MSLYLALGGLLIAAALLGLAFWIANRIMYPRRQPLSTTPQACGLRYENVVFPSSDGLPLKGWWIPAGRSATRQGADPAVILLHPMFGNRHGLDAKQGWLEPLHIDLNLLPFVQAFHQAGFAALLFDFRSHGESPAGMCAGGLLEDQDVAGAVDYVFGRLAESFQGQTPQVGILGFGMGACAAIAAIGREKGGTEILRVFTGDMEGGAGYTDILPANVKLLRFLIAVQPASLGDWLGDAFRKRIAPLRSLLLYLVDAIIQRGGGYPLEGNILQKYARSVNVPVLFVQARADPLSGALEKLVEAVPGQSQVLWMETPRDRMEGFQYAVDHPEVMLAFAQEQMGTDAPLAIQ
jgi:pimeloyl-ACP methyl ester carboxylesterase